MSVNAFVNLTVFVDCRESKLRKIFLLSRVAFTPNQPVCQKWVLGVESILAMPGFRKLLLVKPSLSRCHLRAECFFARSDMHLCAIGSIFNVCAFEWKRCLWLFATPGSLDEKRLLQL